VEVRNRYGRVRARERIPTVCDCEVKGLAFGSMRLLEGRLSKSHWLRLLRQSADIGVDLWHSSDEYESFELFSELNRQLRRENPSLSIRHVVKLADPHFGQDRFNPMRLSHRVDTYLHKLAADCIDTVQWMWRANLDQEERRLQDTASQDQEMQATFQSLKDRGKIGRIMPFPYTYGFAEWVIARPWCDGLTCYLNPLETEMLPMAHRAAHLHKQILALRPLAGGRAITAYRTADDCFAWTVMQPAVEAAVVSFSSQEHRDKLLAVCRF
jgi:aryl-alcohol dehydrogenase-like predicted oxidoreductase